MVQPNNYMLNLPNPTQAVMDSLAIKNAIDQQNQKKAQAQRAGEFQSALSSISANPSPSAIVKVMSQFPEYGEQLSSLHGASSAEKQKNDIRSASQVYSAILNGQHDIARGLLEEQAQAYRNSGMESEAAQADNLITQMDLEPNSAATTAGIYLSSAMGADFEKTFSTLQGNQRENEIYPNKVKEASSKADKAAIESKFAESNAAAELEKKQIDIQKIQNDIDVSRQNQRLAIMDKQLQREQNALKRKALELKIQEQEEKRDSLVREKVAKLESSRMNIDNMLNTAERILNTPIGVIESATGPISSKLPTLSEDVADFEALIENIDAQAFLAQIPNLKGSGALSDAEGKKLAAALQNFSLKQSPSRLIKNVKEAQRLLLKARENLAREYGVAETIPDTPDVSPDTSQLSKSEAVEVDQQLASRVDAILKELEEL